MIVINHKYYTIIRVVRIVFAVLLFLSIESTANEFYHLNTTTSAYPQVKIEGILINNSQVVDINNTALIVSENGIQRDISSISCPKREPDENGFEILIVIDFSASMKDKNYQIIKQAISNVISTFDFKETRIGITGFNNTNFLIHDFSNVKASLLNSLENLPHFGSSNLEAAFLGSPSGAISIFESFTGRKEIILISDGSESGNLQLIREELLKSKARLNSLTMDFATSAIVKNLTNATGGYSIDKINNIDQLSKSLTSFLYLAEFQTACQIIYKSFTCKSENTVNLNFVNTGISRNINVNVPEQYFPALIAEPSYFYFGLITPPAKPQKIIKLTAKYGDIDISGFTESPFFKVISQPQNFIIKAGESRDIIVQFSPVDSSYVYGEIKAIANHCKGGIIRLSGGSDRLLDVEKTIKVVKPNGGEFIPTGSFYTIEWDGILPTDTVKIEYSTNNGNTWFNITNSATGLKYLWRTVPNSISNTCLIRVSQLSKYDLSKNILSLKGIQGNVRNLVWRDERNEIYTGSTDGFIRLWSAVNGEPVKTIAGGINDLLDFDISPDYKYVAYITLSSNKITIKNIDDESEEFNFELPGEEILHLDWNPKNNFISAGTKSGITYLWDFPNTTPVQVWNYSEQINSLEWDRAGELIAVGYEDGRASIFSTNQGVINNIKASDQRLNSVTFNPTGSVILTSSMNELIKVWDIISGTNLTTLFNNIKPVNVVSWDPTVSFIASASADSSVSLWQPGTGSKFYTFRGHNSNVNGIKWRNDGKRIASSTSQGEVFIWSPDDIPFSRPTLQEDTSDNVWSIVNPSLQTKPVIFAPVRIRDFKDSTISNIIYNQNNYDIIIDTLFIRGWSASFRVSGGIPVFPYNLKAETGIDLQITFNPQTLGGKIDTIVYLSGLREYRSILFGFAEEKLIEVTPSSHNFGIVKVGSSSDEFTFSIKNISNTDVFLDNIASIINSDNQFEILEFTSGYITPGEIRNVNVVFSPSRFFMSGALFDVIYDGKNGPDYVSLTGSGAAPQINYQPEIILPDLICEDSFSQEIIIRNIGNETLKINSIVLSDDSSVPFSLDISGTNFEIKEGDSTKLILNFTNALAGDYDAEIIINSEINADNTTQNIIKTNIRRGISNYKLYPQNLAFYLENTGVEDFKDIRIINTGTVPINWQNPIEIEYFSIELINPPVTLPGDTSKATIKFKGALENGLYAGQLAFKDSCNKEINLNLTAYIGPSDAKIEAVNKIEFPDVICNADTTYINLNIRNIGTTPLIFSESSFSLGSNAFIIFDEVSEINISAGGDYTIKLGFYPNKSGISTDKLIFNSNAKNYPSGIFEIELSGFFGTIEYDLSDELIEKLGLLPNEKPAYSFDIFNKGSLPIEWNISTVYNYFQILSIEPLITQPGKSSKVMIQFKGGEQGLEYSEIIKFENLCNSIDSIELRAIVDGFARVGLRIGEASAKPGDIVEIPIFLFSTNDTELPDVAGYYVSFEFNPTLLVPISDYEGYVENGLRFINLKLPSSPLDESGTVATITFRATLGNEDSTVISFKSTSAIESPDIKIQEIDGLFRLDSLCYENGVRLIGNSGRLLLGQNAPNPVTELSKIKFSVIETGFHNIVIYDLLGNPVKTIFAQSIIPGDYEVQFHLKELPVGNYIYKLTTPTTHLSRKMTVNR